MTAIDVGTGTGVLAFLLAKRGVGQVIATETAPRAIACAQDNQIRLLAAGFKEVANVRIIQSDLFPDSGRAQLIVCNPPWLPARPGSALEQAVYDEDSRMLQGFFSGLRSQLKPGGQAWLILSDLAERLGLRTRDQWLGWVEAAGLKLVERHDTAPKHAKAQDKTDALYEARSKEITSLWRFELAT